MIRTACFITLVVCVVGCSDAPSIDGNVPASNPSTAATIDAARMTQVRSPDSLISTYQAAYDSGAVETIALLVHWGESNESQRSVTNRILVNGAGEKRVLASKLVAAEEYREAGQRFTGTQSHSVELRLGTDASSRTVNWPIGKINGEFRFLAWLSED